MSAAADRKIVLVTRKTRLEELVAQYHTLAQARFYIEHLGAEFSDYVQENLAYGESLRQVNDALRRWGRYQVGDAPFQRVARGAPLPVTSLTPTTCPEPVKIFVCEA